MPGNILIVDAVASSRILLRAQLAPGFFNLSFAESGGEALQDIIKEPPDLMLILPSVRDMPIRRLCRELQRLGSCAPPFIVVQPEESRARRLRLLSWGATDVLAQPLNISYLITRMRAGIRNRAAIENFNLAKHAMALDAKPWSDQPPHSAASRVATFRDDPSRVNLPGDWQHRREDRPEFRAAAKEPPQRIAVVQHRVQDAKDLIAQLPPDDPHEVHALSYDQLFATDLNAYDGLALVVDGWRSLDILSFIASLHAGEQHRHVEVLTIGTRPKSPSQLALLAETLEMGAQDAMTYGPDPEELTLRLHAMTQRNAQRAQVRQTLQHGLDAAWTDPLTALGNRRHAMQHLHQILPQGVALMLLDIDHFKQVNDLHGHDAGDAVLVQLAQRLGALAPDGAEVSRIGGEEFLLVTPLGKPSDSHALAEMIRQQISSTPFTLPDGGELSLTVSLGLALSQPFGTPNPQPASAPPQVAEAVSDVMKRADLALYQSKAIGRNQVTLYQPAA